MRNHKYVVEFVTGDSVVVFAGGAIDAMVRACAIKADRGLWNLRGKVIDTETAFVYEFDLTKAIG